MTIAQDMATALTVIARVRAMLAGYPAWKAQVAQLGASIAALEDCMDRTRQIEAGPVPAHWLHQDMPAEACAGVVSLAEVRARRQQARVVRL